MVGAESEKVGKEKAIADDEAAKVQVGVHAQGQSEGCEGQCQFMCRFQGHNVNIKMRM